jgi:hypothetical protein
MGKKIERSSLTPQEAGPMGCGPCYNLNRTNKEGGIIYTCGKLDTPLLSAFVGMVQAPLHRYSSNTVDVIICPRGLFPGSVSTVNDAVHMEQQERDKRLK